MSLLSLGAYAFYAFVSSITPGPNNMLLMASGATFGFRRTLPQMFGIALGFDLMLFACGLGVGALFHRFPWVEWALRVLATLWLLVLAWGVYHISPVGEGSSGIKSGKPFTVWGAALFQVINPKAWTMAVGAATGYFPKDLEGWGGMALFVGIFTLVLFPCNLTWIYLGTAIRRWLENPQTRRAVGVVLALLTLGCGVVLWL